MERKKPGESRKWHIQEGGVEDKKISIRRIDRNNENYEGKICGQIGKDYIHKPTNN